MRRSTIYTEVLSSISDPMTLQNNSPLDLHQAYPDICLPPNRPPSIMAILFETLIRKHMREKPQSFSKTASPSQPACNLQQSKSDHCSRERNSSSNLVPIQKPSFPSLRAQLRKERSVKPRHGLRLKRCPGEEGLMLDAK